MSDRRVVITGLGVVSSIGIGIDDFWKNLVNGKSGICDIETFHALTYPSLKGGEIKNFKPKRFKPKGIGRASQFAIEAAKEALDDAGLSDSSVRRDRIGVIIGTTNGESQVLEEIDRIWLEKGESEVWSSNIIKYPMDSISRNLTYYFNIKGFSHMIATACSAGNYSIGYGYDLIKMGKMDVMIVGGSDPLTRYAFAGFGRLFAMAPEKCQPFDKNRKGMMVGEGAGILILEDLEFAKKRKADIYTELSGYGLSCDAFRMTIPTKAGVVKVMQKALKNSNIKNEEVDYICAHGTGTPVNDKTECSAIKMVFGSHAEKLLINSIKSMLGHTMGAASAIEAVSTILTIKNGVIPPTINHEEDDPECEGIDCVPNKARKKAVGVALSNSLAFGGNNACVAFKRYE